MRNDEKWSSPLDAFYSLESALSNFTRSGSRRQKIEHLGNVFSAISRYCPPQNRGRVDFISEIFSRCSINTSSGFYNDFSRITNKEMERLISDVIFLYTSCALDLHEYQYLEKGRALDVLSGAQESRLRSKARSRQD